MIPPTSQNPAEFKQLLNLYKRISPKNILEIGTHEGGTLYHWLKYASSGSIVASIDNQGMISEAQASQWATYNATPRCLRQDSSSQEAIEWARNNVSPIDWLFIDGGHSYRQALEDWQNYSTLVSENGIIIFHDICPQKNSEVNILWRQLKGYYPHQEIIEPHVEWGVGPGIGILYND